MPAFAGMTANGSRGRIGRLSAALNPRAGDTLYPAFFLAPGFAGCFSSAAFVGEPPAIGNSISR